MNPIKFQWNNPGAGHPPIIIFGFDAALLIDVCSAIAEANAAGKLSSRYDNIRALVGLERMNLMDETTAIDLGLGDPEVDKVKCPEHDNLITRQECLDYSGTHHDVCSGCEIGKATKERLLPPKN